MSSLAYYNYTANRINSTSLNGSLFYQFTTPNIYPQLLNSTFTYSLNLTFSFHSEINNISTIVGGPTNFKAFIYHDRGAFMGDFNGNKTRTENPYFYKYSLNILENTSTNSFEFTTYPNQTYYISLRPDLQIGFPTSFVSVVPWFSSIVQIKTQFYWLHW